MVVWIRLDAVDNRERKFPFGKILPETFILCVGIAPQIEIVVSDLEYDTQDIHQGNVVTSTACQNISSHDARSTYRPVLLTDCIRRTASRKSPPVLLDTI